jgi:hypothetical protein
MRARKRGSRGCGVGRGAPAHRARELGGDRDHEQLAAEVDPDPGVGHCHTPSLQACAQVALVVGVEPGFEDPEGIIETVGAADRGERVTAADGAGATQCLERGEGELGLS